MTKLYRYYNAHDRLLRVGTNKRRPSETARVDVRQFATAEDAAFALAIAIRDEKPMTTERAPAGDLVMLTARIPRDLADRLPKKNRSKFIREALVKALDA